MSCVNVSLLLSLPILPINRVFVFGILFGSLLRIASLILLSAIIGFIHCSRRFLFVVNVIPLSNSELEYLSLFYHVVVFYYLELLVANKNPASFDKRIQDPRFCKFRGVRRFVVRFSALPICHIMVSLVQS